MDKRRRDGDGLKKREEKLEDRLLCSHVPDQFGKEKSVDPGSVLEKELIELFSDSQVEPETRRKGIQQQLTNAETERSISESTTISSLKILPRLVGNLRDDGVKKREEKFENRLRCSHVPDGFGKGKSVDVSVPSSFLQKELIGLSKLSDSKVEPETRRKGIQGAIMECHRLAEADESDPFLKHISFTNAETETSLAERSCSAPLSRMAEFSPTASICSPSCRLDFSGDNPGASIISEVLDGINYKPCKHSNSEKTAISSLPHDLEEEIIHRLPIDWLVQYHLACRNLKWFRLSEWFIHVRASQVWMLDIAQPRYVKICDFGRELIRSMVQCQSALLCSTLSSSKGKAISRLLVWDLFETKWIEKEDLSLYDFYLLGHDSNKLCKILRFHYGCHDRDYDNFEFGDEIYEFSSKRWRFMEFEDAGCSSRPMKVVSLQGNSYWLVVQEGKKLVQSFDFSREEFRQISIPEVGGSLVLSSQGNDALLLLVQEPRKSNIKIWIRQLNRQSAAWEKFFEVKRAVPPVCESFLLKEEKIMAFSEKVLENGTAAKVKILKIGQEDEIEVFQTEQFGSSNEVSINSVYAPSFRTKNKVEVKSEPRIFSFNELHQVTESFDDDYKIGEGRFGSVYWGELSDGSQIAVKRLKAWSNREEIDFAVEVEILARIRHKNLLSVRGYCEEGQERLIVYDYMPKLSLVSCLHGHSLLDWTRRMNIAVTTAQAIAYLHHSATPRIVHGDVRASNVLLDSEFEARVTDFGYGKLMPDDAEDGATKTTKGNNDLGYLSAECIESGKESVMGDVYSFGIVLLELVTGMRPIERVNQTTKLGITKRVLSLVYDRKFGEIVDERLNGKYVEEELKRVVLVGLLCVQIEPGKRPTMSQVVEMLMSESKENMALH